MDSALGNFSKSLWFPSFTSHSIFGVVSKSESRLDSVLGGGKSSALAAYLDSLILQSELLVVIWREFVSSPNGTRFFLEGGRGWWAFGARFLDDDDDERVDCTWFSFSLMSTVKVSFISLMLETETEKERRRERQLVLCTFIIGEWWACSIRSALS